MSSIALFIGLLFVGTILLARMLFFLVEVNGQSMFPVLQDGDRVIVLRYFFIHGLHKGQIVVWVMPRDLKSTHIHVGGNATLIKRIIGLPGDTVILHDSELSGPPSLTVAGQSEQANRIWQITEGHCFVKGDSPGFDSTTLGPIPLDWIRGIMLVKLWRVYNKRPTRTPANLPEGIEKVDEL